MTTRWGGLGAGVLRSGEGEGVEAAEPVLRCGWEGVRVEARNLTGVTPRCCAAVRLPRMLAQEGWPERAALDDAALGQLRFASSHSLALLSLLLHVHAEWTAQAALDEGALGQLQFCQQPSLALLSLLSHVQVEWTARAAVDEGTLGQLEFASDTLSMAEVAEAYKEALGEEAQVSPGQGWPGGGSCWCWPGCRRSPAATPPTAQEASAGQRLAAALACAAAA